MSPPATSVSKDDETPSLEVIAQVTERVLGYRPCTWQAEVSQALLKKQQDVISIAKTGSGKTLTFWIPLLFKPEGIQIVITALTVLGKQNEVQLGTTALSAVSISSETATLQNFTAIEEGLFRVVVISPELLMKKTGGFQKLLRNSAFVSRIQNVIVDEGHCLTEWGSFRPEYTEIGTLRLVLPPSVTFMVVSATLSERMCDDIMSSLRFRPSKTLILRRSNDRENVLLAVRKISHSLQSFADLFFLIPPAWKEGDPAPRKFIVFFDNIADCVKAGLTLRRQLPIAYRHRLKWFHSIMSTEYKEEEVERFKKGETWGLFATDSFGMGMDIPDITLVVQWRATCNMCSLWQQYGRGARDPKLTAIAVLFAESKFFDGERKKTAARKKKREETRKRKASVQVTEKTPKRARIFPSGHMPRSPLANLDQNIDLNSNNDTGTLLTTRDIGDNEEEGESADEYDAEVEDLRRRYLAGCLPCVPNMRGKKRKKIDMDPAIDDMINADERQKIGCRRYPASLMFGNDKIGADNRPCIAGGAACPRCSLNASTTCCDIHTPSAFTNLAATLHDKPQRLQNRCRVPDFVDGPQDRQLWNALHEWRNRKTVEVHGQALYISYDPSLVLPNAVLRRIVDCAHIFKISSSDALKMETRWPFAMDYADEILALIACHGPTPPPPPPPPQSPFVRTPLPPRRALQTPTQNRTPCAFEHPRMAPCPPGNPTTTGTPVAPALFYGPAPSPRFAGCQPPPLIASVLPAVSTATATAPRKRTVTCKACKQEGHNSRNRACVNHPSKKIQPNNENTVPLS